MKKSPKKLTLNRETIGRLTEEKLAEAAGGATMNSCAATCGCPSIFCTLACPTQTGCIKTFTC